MKKYFLLCFLYASFSSLFAFDGLYVGGAAGGTILTGVQRGDALGVFTASGVSNIFPIELGGEFFSENALAKLYAGFGFQWHCLYGGVELFGKYAKSRGSIDRHNINLLPAELAEESSFDHTDLKTGGWHWGLSARGGFLISPLTLLYGRVGFEKTQVKLRTNGRASGAIGLNQFFDVTVIDRARKRRAFFQAGIGLEQRLTPCLTLAGEYGYTDYGKIRVSNQGRLDFAPGVFFTFRGSKAVHAYQHEVTLRLSYYFKNSSMWAPCTPCGCFPNFCGWYTGVGAADMLTLIEHQFDLTAVSPGFNTGDPGIHIGNYHVDLSKYRFKGILYGGYSYPFCLSAANLFAGLELFVSGAPDRIREKEIQLFFSGFVPATFDIISITRLQTKIHPFQFGVQGRVGFFLTPLTTIYGIVGTSIAKIRAEAKTVFTNPVPPGFSINLALSDAATRATLRYGLGLEHDLGYGFHVRGDYITNDYGHLNLKGSVVRAVGGPIGTVSVTNDSKVHFRDHTVMLGISKYW